ncbi:hypothetical protein SNOG_01393 [Parastagonospora nodorum SN15]|uniref:Uncharacterized protein n=1 Tax=Phaeosphaeria nodorum (strain SN15 / ATCC MYA-4574 / FGSC 10173) TaxID=321614 RepID=Q0V3M1_PHANO|nr:hypothetical protein SNOG_01393 [Parastagonospora nodorum SN15]EAT91042.1 hypothetical protein SNOG_01393 [Parastagonospora nodorum SN15]
MAERTGYAWKPSPANILTRNFELKRNIFGRSFPE